ncbi:glycoside hydrolase family 65 protein [Nocardiopsis potens]|uniref:glycoside hydrolase family 65 protein n=1 Tax=Nocardiopsis potens TaxID=1246458 RepID=UPI0003478461|nr:glycosyl hydrolase family 65 protein [Nocardiopsis potens]
MSGWRLVHEGPGGGRTGTREALCTLGNGLFATRGAAPEARADGVNYPGTYIAGCYDRAVSSVGGRRVENEDLVNAPNWLPLTFRCGDGAWCAGPDPAGPDRTELDMRRGVLTRTFLAVDGGGRRTRVVQRRLVSMDDPHLAALETTLAAENWSGRLTVRSALDGETANAGVARYRGLASQHLRPEGAGGGAPGAVWLRCATAGSGVGIALAARTRAVRGPEAVHSAPPARAAWAGCDLSMNLVEGGQVTVEKVVALYTSRDRAIGDPLGAARSAADRAGSFEALLLRHAAAWSRLWRACDVAIEDEEDQQALRLHLFHLLQTVSPHTAELDAGVPARGLHGEAYRGHVFWDELFVLPFLNLHFPETARAMLRYRWRRLPAARRAARAAGLRGALFPWQSGSDGREESQRLHLNPRSGRWLPDHSHLQRHVGLAVAYNVWQHHQATGDLSFLAEFGAELLVEVARAFADAAVYDSALDRYRIRGVMGPDEYHDGMPGRSSPGLDDNAYTNVMAVWVMLRAMDALEALPEQCRTSLEEAIGLSPAETACFETLSRRMHVPFHDEVISQFDGYEELAELDWDAYRDRYGDIRRLDRILEAEGDSCNRYRASKQADVLMLFFLLSADELAGLLRRLGLPYDPGLIPRTVEYYLARTCHGSTLSSVVHAWVLSRTDREASWRFFREALRSDIDDSQGGTTAEGIHLGAMAGTIDLLTRCYTGLELREGVLHLSPLTPAELPVLSFVLRYRDHWGVRLEVDGESARVSVPPSAAPPFPVELKGRRATAAPCTSCELPLR